ncbi:TIGR03089 family protein [Cellulomonas sp. ATA003]|nr:TIGR03089 family protein [Cellulomonas sp. ATA003]WNB86336.1 TIGR03089 family protein [Cellulomonas sp. ATA003]
MTPASVAQVLDLVTREPGRPRLTWYGDGGERVELSGAVLANWVSKTTNLLVEELDAGPGTRIRLDLPPHWRTVLWALSAWRCGATVVVGGDGAPADVVVTDRVDTHSDAGQLVAVALPALARAVDGDLPPGAIDAASAVMTYGDVLGWVPGTEPDRPALETAAGVAVTHAELLAPATTPTAPGARVLLATGGDRYDAVLELLRSTLAVLSADGSLVLVAEPVAADLAADPPRRERLVATERISAPADGAAARAAGPAPAAVTSGRVRLAEGDQHDVAQPSGVEQRRGQPPHDDGGHGDRRRAAVEVRPRPQSPPAHARQVRHVDHLQAERPSQSGQAVRVEVPQVRRRQPALPQAVGHARHAHPAQHLGGTVDDPRRSGMLTTRSPPGTSRLALSSTAARGSGRCSSTSLNVMTSKRSSGRRASGKKPTRTSAPSSMARRATATSGSTPTARSPASVACRSSQPCALPTSSSLAPGGAPMP